MPATRALILVRLSRLTDETTSPERQEADCRRYCQAHGMTVVDVASDTDVSGSVDPLDRPALGPWLRDRLPEVDLIIASKLDRVGRNARHIHALMDYLINAGKSLKTVSDNIDITSAMGRMIVYIMATVAEMELDEISRRNSSAAAYNIQRGTYRGGTIPAGYKPEKDDAATWRLVPDEDGLAPVVRDIVTRVASGERVASVIADLNTRGVPTPKDRQDELAGRTPKGRRWVQANFRRLICSPTVIGQAVYRETETDENGQPRKDASGRKVYGAERVVFEDGAPLQRAEPLVSREVWDTARQRIEGRANERNGTRRATEGALLTGVGFCQRCGSKLYRNVRTDRRDVYRCNSAQQGRTCGNGTVICQVIDQDVSDGLIATLGFLPHVERQWEAGSDSAATLAQVDAELQSYTAAVGRFPVDSPAWQTMMAQVDALAARRTELASQPDRASGYHYVPTGRTFADHWATLSVAERNDFLRDHGFKVHMNREVGSQPTWTVDYGDYLGMVDTIHPGMTDTVRAYFSERGMPAGDQDSPPFWPEGAEKPRSFNEWL